MNEKNTMHTLILVAGLSFALTGCYTMVYPPIEEMYGYGPGDSVLVDSTGGRNITIINQNQVILDRYYQDPFYYRGGFYGGYGYWDPYYYNPYGWRHHRHWHDGRYYDGPAPTPQPPKPKQPRRKEDVRDPDPPPSGSVNPAIDPGLMIVTEPNQPIQQVKPKDPPDDAQPPAGSDTSKGDSTKVEQPKRSLRSIEPATAKEPDKPADPPKEPPKEEKKQRRGDKRGR